MLAGALAYPFFWLVNTKEPLLIWLATVLIVGVAHAAVFAPLAAFFSELFGTGVRYSGVSIGFQLGALVAGAPTPFVATWLLSGSGGEPWTVAALVVGAALVTIVSTWLLAETYQKNVVETTV